MSPEELEAYRAKTSGPMYRKPEGKAPMKLNFSSRNQTEEEDKMNLTKEEYLALRLAGKNRSAICKEHATNPPSFYAQLSKWGIKDKPVEDAVLEGLQRDAVTSPYPQEDTKGIIIKPPVSGMPICGHGTQPSKCEICNPIPVYDVTDLPSPTDAQLERAKAYHEGWQDAKEHGKLTGETFTATIGLPDDIEWFTAETVRKAEPIVTLSAKSFAFDSASSKALNLKPGDRLKIGFSNGRLIFMSGSPGLCLQRNGKDGARVTSHMLAKWPRWQAIAKKKYPVRLADGMIVVEVEVAGE